MGVVSYRLGFVIITAPTLWDPTLSDVENGLRVQHGPPTQRPVFPVLNLSADVSKVVVPGPPLEEPWDGRGGVVG